MVQSLETVLVVHDTAIELKSVVSHLESANFHVLEADSAAGAIKLANAYSGRIDLLLADLEMQAMSGPMLSEELKKTRPDLHVMFVCGSSRGDLLVLHYGWTFRTFIENTSLPTRFIEVVNSAIHSSPNSLASDPYDMRRTETNGQAAMSYRRYVNRK